jgi:transcriptional regulator with XRE-family HTH domain
VGSRGVKNLAAKLLLALLPPNSPFFRLGMSQKVKDQLAQGDPAMQTEIEEGLNKIEQTTASEIEQTSTRVTTSEALLHFLICGNVLLYIPEDGNTRMFSLNQYIVKRDPAGSLRRIITKEEIARELLNDRQKLLLDSKPPSTLPREPTSDTDLKNVAIYTDVYLEDDRWHVRQELNGIPDPEAGGSYPKDGCAYIPLRFRKVDGEDYGRGYVEEVIGDLRSLEGLSQAVVEAAAGMAKMLVLVNPNGVTSKKTISTAPNLAVRDGRAEDVSFMRSDKQADLSFVDGQIERIERRLELAFLLNTAVQRDAERVTAEEIRYVAQELEDSQGGVYSILAQEFQLPLATRFINIGQKKGTIPVLPKNSVRPQIITGLEALGRGHDLTRIQTFVAEAKEVVPPDQLPMYIDISDILKQVAIAIGIDPKSVKSAEDVAQQQQQQQMAALAQKVGPNLVNKTGDIMKQQHANAAAALQAQPTPNQ